MDIDEKLANISASEPSATISVSDIPQVTNTTIEPIVKHENGVELTTSLTETGGGRSMAQDLPSEDVNAENNAYYRLLMHNFDDWGASVPRVVSSPVTTAHFKSLPPLAALSVYSALFDASIEQSSLHNAFITLASPSTSHNINMRTETTPFLCSNLKSTWRPLPAPHPTLIDISLPSLSEEWQSITNRKTVPSIDVLLDPEHLVEGDILIKWRSIGTFSKLRRFGKRAIAISEPIVPKIKEENVEIEEPAPIKPFPRNAKKRSREVTANEQMEQEMEEDRISKRRKEATNDPKREMFIRFPVALALSMARSTFSTSNSKKNHSMSNGSNATIDPSAAELLASFRSS
jgi:hypothetical protein